MVGAARKNGDGRSRSLRENVSEAETVGEDDWLRGITVQEYHEWWEERLKEVADREAAACRLAAVEAEEGESDQRPALKKARVLEDPGPEGADAEQEAGS